MQIELQIRVDGEGKPISRNGPNISILSSNKFISLTFMCNYYYKLDYINKFTIVGASYRRNDLLPSIKRKTKQIINELA
jgi:hypothetical protein